MEERAIASHSSTDLIITMLYDAMLSTVIRQDKRKKGQNRLDRRRREMGWLTGILKLFTSFVFHREVSVQLGWLGRYGVWWWCYGLAGPEFEFLKGQDTFRQNTQADCGTHPAFCSVCTWVLSPGVKRSGFEVDYVHIVLRLGMGGVIPLLPPPLYALIAWVGITLRI